jgi:hypothetical protein
MIYRIGIKIFTAHQYNRTQKSITFEQGGGKKNL